MRQIPHSHTLLFKHLLGSFALLPVMAWLFQGSSLQLSQYLLSPPASLTKHVNILAGFAPHLSVKVGVGEIFRILVAPTPRLRVPPVPPAKAPRWPSWPRPRPRRRRCRGPAARGSTPDAGDWDRWGPSSRFIAFRVLKLSAKLMNRPG